MKTYDTQEEIRLAEIAVETAEDRLASARADLHAARREHEIATHVIQKHWEEELAKPAVERDTDAMTAAIVEDLHDELFDYDTAEAIVRHRLNVRGRVAS